LQRQFQSAEEGEEEGVGGKVVAGKVVAVVLQRKIQMVKGMVAKRLLVKGKGVAEGQLLHNVGKGQLLQAGLVL